MRLMYSDANTEQMDFPLKFLRKTDTLTNESKNQKQSFGFKDAALVMCERQLLNLLFFV